MCLGYPQTSFRRRQASPLHPGFPHSEHSGERSAPWQYHHQRSPPTAPDDSIPIIGGPRLSTTGRIGNAPAPNVLCLRSRTSLRRRNADTALVCSRQEFAWQFWRGSRRGSTCLTVLDWRRVAGGNGESLPTTGPRFLSTLPCRQLDQHRTHSKGASTRAAPGCRLAGAGGWSVDDISNGLGRWYTSVL